MSKGKAGASASAGQKRHNWLAISFAALVLCTVLIYAVSSAFFTVRIKQIKVLGDDGLTYACDIYVPKTATNANPAPTVMFNLGGGCVGDICSDWGIELARRGYVTVIADGVGRGSSEMKKNISKDTVDAEENKIYRMTNYVRNIYDAFIDFPFVDTNDVTIIGHSVGTNISAGLTQFHAGEIKSLIELEGMGWSGTSRELIKDTNLYALLSLQDHFWRGYTDESAEVYVEEQMANFDPAIENPQMGVMYGDPNEGGATMVRWTSEKLLHGSAGFAPSLKTDALDFLQEVSPAPNPIASDNILSMWKDILGVFAILSLVWFIINLTLALVRTKTFNSLVVELPRNIGIEKSSWISTTLVSMIGGVAVFILATNYLPQQKTSILWNVDTYTKIAPYLLVCPLLDVVSFYFLFHRKKKIEGLASARNYGLAFEEGSKGPGWRNLLKAALVGIIVSGVVLTYISFIKRNFGINIQAWWQGYSMADLQTVANSGGMIILFLWLFSVGQLSQNVVRRSVGLKNEQLDIAVSVLINVLIAAVPMAIVALTQVVALNWHSSIFKATNIQTFYAMPIGIAIATTIHTVLYRKTGTIWVGMFVCGIFMGIMACATMAFTSMFLIG